MYKKRVQLTMRYQSTSSLNVPQFSVGITPITIFKEKKFRLFYGSLVDT